MIRAEHIKFDYIRRDGEDNVIAVETAVNDVSFEVKTGEFVAILGHNGSGKSTLARHINALLVPEEGTMYVDGIPESGQPDCAECCGRRCWIWTGEYRCTD